MGCGINNKGKLCLKYQMAGKPWYLVVLQQQGVQWFCNQQKPFVLTTDIESELMTMQTCYGMDHYHKLVTKELAVQHTEA